MSGRRSDLPPGSLYTEAITNAIASSKIYVLIASKNSIKSKQVHNEVVLANNYQINGLKIFSIIIDDKLNPTSMHPAIDYVMSGKQSIFWESLSEKKTFFCELKEILEIDEEQKLLSSAIDKEEPIMSIEDDSDIDVNDEYMDEESNHRKKIVCFIDDDINEIKRFCKAMKDDYICITGQSFADCKRKLEKRKLKPDLFVLDLFFPVGGAKNTSEQIIEMNNRYARLQEENAKFRKYLAEIHQGSSGGIKLLQLCKAEYDAPVVMLTRKGTLEDSIACIENGAEAVYKKPMPTYWPETTQEQKRAMDQAMIEGRNFLVDKFDYYIHNNSKLNKYKAQISCMFGILIGVIMTIIIGYIV